MRGQSGVSWEWQTQLDHSQVYSSGNKFVVFCRVAAILQNTTNLFPLLYNNEKIPISIPNNFESMFWCYDETSFVLRGEILCNFPFYGSINGKTGAFFEPIIGKDGNKYCVIEDKEYIAKQCTKQGNMKRTRVM